MTIKADLKFSYLKTEELFEADPDTLVHLLKAYDHLNKIEAIKFLFAAGFCNGKFSKDVKSMELFGENDAG